MSNIQPIFIQVIRKPERLCIIKRGRCAEDYFPLLRGGQLRRLGHAHEYALAVRRAGRHVAAGEVQKPGTSTYVQGVEAEPDDPGIVPEYIVYCLVSLATLAAAALLWGMRLRGSLPAFLGSWALTVLSTLSVGLLVGGVAKDTRQASFIASILYFPSSLFRRPPPRGQAEGHPRGGGGFFPLTQGILFFPPPGGGGHDDEACVSRHRSGQHPAHDLRHARPDRPLHPPLPPLLPLGITQTPPPAPPAGVLCLSKEISERFFQEAAARRGHGRGRRPPHQSRASLYMTEQYG